MRLNRLKGLMREKEKTQRDLAELLGVSITTANAKLNGRRKFTLDEALDVVQWLESPSIEEVFFKN